MLKASLRHYSPVSQLLLSLMIVLFSFFLSMFLGSILAKLIFDFNIIKDTQAIDATSGAANISLLKFYQAIYSFGMFVLPPFVVAYLLSHHPRKYLYLDKRLRSRELVMAFVIIFVALPGINLLGEINSYMSLPDFLSGIENWMKSSEESAKYITEKFLVMNNFSDLAVNLIVIAIIPALGEELLFRGVLQGIFSKMTHNKHWGIVITAFLFAALHMQFYGLLPRMAMGVVFGYLLIWSGNLWIPVITHLINNGMAVIAAYYINQGKIPQDIETFGAHGQFSLIGITSILAVIFLLYTFRQVCKRQA